MQKKIKGFYRVKKLSSIFHRNNYFIGRSGGVGFVS